MFATMSLLLFTLDVISVTVHLNRLSLFQLNTTCEGLCGDSDQFAWRKKRLNQIQEWQTTHGCTLKSECLWAVPLMWPFGLLCVSKFVLCMIPFVLILKVEFLFIMLSAVPIFLLSSCFSPDERRWLNKSIIFFSVMTETRLCCRSRQRIFHASVSRHTKTNLI